MLFENRKLATGGPEVLALPLFRSPQDRLAFAMHAFVLGKGMKTIAVGRAAEQAASSPDGEPYSDFLHIFPDADCIQFAVASFQTEERPF